MFLFMGDFLSKALRGPLLYTCFFLCGRSQCRPQYTIILIMRTPEMVPLNSEKPQILTALTMASGSRACPPGKQRDPIILGLYYSGFSRKQRDPIILGLYYSGFSRQVLLHQKTQDNALANWHHLEPTSAGIYSISAFAMPQKCTVTNVTGAY